MDLLNMLSGLMTSSSSINALSAKSGTDSSQAKSIVSTALPMLLGALTQNASSKEGAASLLGALQQHKDTSSMEDQIAHADAEDGGKILQHILGGNRESVMQAISAKTGANVKQVSSLLSNLAPGMMSGISAISSAAGKQAKAAKVTVKAGKASVTSAKEALKEKAKEAAKETEKDIIKETVKEPEKEAAGGLDLGGLLGMLGGQDTKDSGSALGGLGGLLGGFLGGGSGSDDKDDAGSPLLGALKNLFQ